MRDMPTPCAQRPDSGFSLIEVLAALLVFSLSIIGLTHAGTQSAQAVSVIEQKSLAGIAADNALIAARQKPLKLGKVDGQAVQMGRTYNYVVTTTPTEVSGFYALHVEISQDGSEQILVSRNAFRGAQ